MESEEYLFLLISMRSFINLFMYFFSKTAIHLVPNKDPLCEGTKKPFIQNSALTRNRMCEECSYFQGPAPSSNTFLTKPS